jgi:hypothetical protein
MTVRTMPVQEFTWFFAALTWAYLRDYYPVSTFWPMQFFEGGWLLVLSVLLAAGTVRLVRHRTA